jgi:hypothetical protein
MPSALVHTVSPEREELEEKRRQLEALNEELAQRELDLATLNIKLERFGYLYVRIVGARYAELDDLEARVAAIRARLKPDNREMAGAAQAARERAWQTRAEAEAATPGLPATRFEPSADLRSLYRDAARRLHPDLAPDADARERRTRLMAAINAAYSAGDEEAMRRILASWEIDPANVSEGGIGADLVRLIRQIAAVKIRIAEIVAEILALASSDLGALYRHRGEAEAAGRDLLQELALNVEDHIAARRRELVEWQVREAAA